MNKISIEKDREICLLISKLSKEILTLLENEKNNTSLKAIEFVAAIDSALAYIMAILIHAHVENESQNDVVNEHSELIRKYLEQYKRNKPVVH